MHFAHHATPGIAVPGGTSTLLWRPDLATGIHEIDLQHEELLANVAALREAVRTGNPGLAEGVLACLERCAAEHFATEERAMWAAGYPALDAHWSLHLSFATELARRKSEHAASLPRASLLSELGRWMERWLEEHMLGADAEMARFIQAQGGGTGTRAPRRDDRP